MNIDHCNRSNNFGRSNNFEMTTAQQHELCELCRVMSIGFALAEPN
jgi:hypothetical protein